MERGPELGSQLWSVVVLALMRLESLLLESRLITWGAFPVGLALVSVSSLASSCPLHMGLHSFQCTVVLFDEYEDSQTVKES